MPRWLQLWLSLYLCAMTVVSLGFVMSQLIHRGEAPFDQEQRAFLEETFPRGNYTSNSTYRWCDGRIFQYFDSRGDQYHLNEPCWKVSR